MKKTARRAGRAAQPPTKNKQLKIKKTKAYTYIFTKTPNQNVSVLALVLLLCGLGLHPLTARAVSLSLGQTNSFESGTDYVGWYGAYGGYTVLSKDCAHTGSRSLKYSGREESWYSPAINLYETFKENGAGRYRISMWVRTNAVYYYNPNIRMIIRGEGENSFITQEGPNYFYSLTAPISLSPGEWRYLTGTVDVEAGDIAAADGDFLLMLDYMEAVEDQLLYIDDFCIKKETVGAGYVYFEKSLYRFKPYRNSGNSSYSVKAHVSPPNASDQTIRYESSNTLVVSVNENTGQVYTGIPGDATITAYLVSNPNKKSICQVSVKYELDVWHYYDQGLETRYTDAVSGIETGQELVSEIFDEVFGMTITTKTISKYNSPPDICKGIVNKENLDTICNHNPCCSNAHAMYEIFRKGYDGTNNTQMNVLWTGHQTKWAENTNRSFYVKDDNDGSHIVMLLNNETTMVLNGYVLLHETAHAIGAPDHYHDEDEKGNCKNFDICSKCDGPNKRSSSCTMYRKQYYLGSKKNFFCIDCRNDMKAYLLQHH